MLRTSKKDRYFLVVRNPEAHRSRRKPEGRTEAGFRVVILRAGSKSGYTQWDGGSRGFDWSLKELGDDFIQATKTEAARRVPKNLL